MPGAGGDFTALTASCATARFRITGATRPRGATFTRYPCHHRCIRRDDLLHIRADYKSHSYPADAFLSSFTTSPGAGECSRLNGASCTMRRSNELAGQWYDYKTLTTLTASVDRTCDTLPWQPCTESSLCCGAVDGWSCQLTSCPHILPSGECARTQPGSEADRTVAGSETRMCQPPHGGPDFDSRGPDERLFVSWGAKGIDDFNTEAKTRRAAM